MYLTNKYTRWYYNIITNAQSRSIDGYTEKHHIIPQSLGGSNQLDNLVRLTAREHFICHLLLTKMVVGHNKSKMSQAAWMMASAIGKGQDRYNVNNRTYEKLRLNMSAIKKNMTTWNLGITPKDSTRLKLRKASLDHLVKQGKMTQEVADYKNSLPLPPPYIPKKRRVRNKTTFKDAFRSTTS
jgi:hypothetical protein